MARHTFPSFSALWQRHECLYVEIFSAALIELAQNNVVSGDEDVISEMLTPILNHVCFVLSQSRNVDVRAPTWEGPIQPVTEGELKGGKVRKRPDFTCKCVNPFAAVAEEHEISLHVECKRLGSPTSSSWNLNENYVKNGIARFDSSTYEYGKRASSGMMIGYIVSMTPTTVLKEVNNHQERLLPAYPCIVFESKPSKLFQAKQNVQRSHVLPRKFVITHLWLNLVGKYQQ